MQQTVQTALEAGSESAVRAFGTRAQMTKCCEELAELMVQLCKRLNGSPTPDETIVDEVADVLVMAYGMRFIFGADAVDKRILYKLDRIMTFIRNLHQDEKTNDSRRNWVAHDNIKMGDVCEYNPATARLL